MGAGDRALAMLVPVIWGLNFPAMALVLQHYPPYLAAALRFALIAGPTLLLVPRPRVPVVWLIGTGMGVGVVQFAFLFAAMANGMPAGLASVMLQAAAPMTLVLTAITLGERLTSRALAGIALAGAGLALIGAARAQSVSWLPVLLTLTAALGWAAGNLCIRLARAPNPLHLSLWMTVVAPLPLLALSLATEGTRIGPALTGALAPEALTANLSLLFSAAIASVMGYGIWSRLLSRHPAGLVVPWAMLVPFVGLLASWAVLGEVPRPAEMAGGAVVLAGVMLSANPAARRP